MISFIVLFTHKTQKYIPPCLKSVRRRMYKLEVWDWKVACTSFFQRMVQRIQPYILLLSLVIALWLLFYLRFVYEVSFMSLFIEQYTNPLQYTSPTPSDHSGFEDVVVAYCSWSLTRFEQQHVSSEKSLGHFRAILNLRVA